MRALAILLLGVSLSACLNFDKRLGECFDAGKCQASGGASVLAGDASIDFGRVAIGDMSARNYSFVNNGPTPTGPITLFLGDGGVFGIASVGCRDVPLSAGASCVASVSAAPRGPGVVTGTLFIDGGVGASLDVALSVEGIAPVTVDPTSANFGNVSTGSESFRSFTVTNASTQDKTLTQLITGDDFSVADGGTCGASLATANVCTIVVRFGPTSEGPVSGELEVMPTVTATLDGTGRPPGALQFDQDDLDFGLVDAGSSLTKSMILSNTSSTASGPINFSIPGAIPVFAFDAGSCVNGLDGGASCVVSVTFKPQLPGEKQSSLEADSVASGFDSLQLKGTGRVEWALTVMTNFGGSVNFSDPSGAMCPGACTQIYEQGASPQNITLEEMPSSGMMLASWAGCTPASNGCTVVMDQDHVVTATFAPQVPRLFLSVEDGGTAIPTPMGSNCGPGCFEYDAGANVTVNASAVRGWLFGGFSGDCTGATCQFVINGLKNVTAEFNGPHNYAFVTSSSYSSTFFTGLIDQVCANEAVDAGLPAQNFRAWVSRAGTDIKDDPAISNARGWIRPDGLPFADELPVSGRGTVFHPPALTARGLFGPSLVWTGTGSGGQLGDNCQGWSTGTTGIAGTSAGGSYRWTEDGALACTNSGAMVCLGTTNSNDLAIPPPPMNARIIFVTSMAYPPSGGVTANQHCIDEAQNAGFTGGGWKALLAQGANVGAADLPNDNEPIYRPDGVLVAAHSFELRSGAPPLAPIEVSADLRHIDDLVWTGSNTPTDAASGKSCSDWMSNASSAVVGRSTVADNRWWNELMLVQCDQMAHLYCFR